MWSCIGIYYFTLHFLYLSLRLLFIAKLIITIQIIDLAEISAVSVEDVRAISFHDFERALQEVRPSVSQESLQQFVQWNKEYGCVNM